MGGHFRLCGGFATSAQDHYAFLALEQVVMSTERPRCRLVDNTGGAASLSDFQVTLVT